MRGERSSTRTAHTKEKRLRNAKAKNKSHAHERYGIWTKKTRCSPADSERFKVGFENGEQHLRDRTSWGGVACLHGTYLHAGERGRLHAADGAQETRVAGGPTLPVGKSGLASALVLLRAIGCCRDMEAGKIDGQKKQRRQKKKLSRERAERGD